MANPLTVAEYSARMKQAIGNADPSTGFTLLEVLNEALRFVFDYHDWNWRLRPPALVNLVANIAYVALPSDFGSTGELLGVHSVWTPAAAVTKGDLSDIARLRGAPAQNTLNFTVAVVYPGQSSVSVKPAVPRLEIAPTPTASVSNAFRVTYRSGAVDLTASTNVPNVPPEFESALTHIARAQIMFYELGATSADAQAEFNMGTALLNDLKESDGMHDADAGVVHGGAARQYLPGFTDASRPFNSFPTLHA